MDIERALTKKYGNPFQGSPGEGVLLVWQCKDNVFVQVLMDTVDPSDTMANMFMDGADAEIYYMRYITPHYQQYEQEMTAQYQKQMSDKANKLGKGL